MGALSGTRGLPALGHSRLSLPGVSLLHWWPYLGHVNITTELLHQCFNVICSSPVHTVAPAPLALLPVVAPVLGAGRLLAPASGHGLHHGALTVHVSVQASVAGQRFPFSDISYDMTNLSFIDGTTCLSSSPLSRHCCSSAPCHSIHPYCSGAICKQGVKGSHFKIIYFVLLFC